MSFRAIYWLTLLGAAIVLTGCSRTPTSASAGKPAAVVVSKPVKQRVTDFEDFTGRLEAPQTIDLRSRVTGYLDRANFIEGDEVKQNAVLFEIDPRPYRADLDRAEANVAQAEVHFNRLETDLTRAKKLVGTGAVAQEDYDKVAGDRNEAAAAVQSAKASRETAKLNLSFTQVKAPIAGRVSRRYVDPGNLIKADETILTSMVSQDPMHAYFDVDERTVLKLRRLQLDHKVASLKDTGVPVQLSLADEQDFTHDGAIDFADNRVDAGTGTRRLRGVFANPDRLLAPGMFIRVRLPIGQAHSALLVAEQALGSDQGRKYVYVVNDKDEVEYRAVMLGALHDGLRVVEKGLTPGDRVIVTGLQRVRTGTKVDTTLKDMPNPVTAAKAAVTPATAAKAAP